MNDYFQLLYAEEEDYEPYGVGYAPPDTDLFLLPPSGERAGTWKPLTLKLRDGTFADYLANNCCTRLCSERLMNILEQNRSPKDAVQWFDVTVVGSGGERRKYRALHFPEDYAIVNTAKSIMNGDIVVKPVFDARAVSEHRLFTLPKDMGLTMFVSAELKAAIEAAKLTGMSFSKVRVAES